MQSPPDRSQYPTGVCWVEKALVRPGTQCRACGALLTNQRYPGAVEFSASYHGYVEPGVSRRHHHWQAPYALRRRFCLGSALTPTHLTPHFYQSIRIVLGHRPSLCNRLGNVVRVGGTSVRGPWRPCPSWTCARWRTPPGSGNCQSSLPSSVVACMMSALSSFRWFSGSTT